MKEFQTVSERDAYIVEQYIDRKRTMGDIGDELGITRQRIQQILARNGVSGLAPRISDDRKKEDRNKTKIILEYADSNLSLENIARIAGTTPRKVSTIFKSHGIERETVIVSRSQERRAAIYEFIVNNPGVTYVEVARKFGVSYATVVRSLRDKGYFRRNRKDSGGLS